MASSSEQDMEVSDNNTASTSEQNTEEDGVNNTASAASMADGEVLKGASMNMEDGDNNMPSSTSDQNMEEDCGNMASTSEQKMEEDCAKSTASASEQKMEEDCAKSTASASEQKMEEDCAKSTASTSEQNLDLGSGSELEHCSNCKARFNAEVQNKVRISTLIDAKTAKILFPHLPASGFICMECVEIVKSTKLYKQHKNKGTVGGGGVPSLPPAPSHSLLLPLAPTSTQKTGSSVRYIVVPIVGVTGPSTSKPIVKGTIKAPPTFKPNTKVSPRLPTVLPTSWNVKKSANNSDMPAMSKQSAEGSGSDTVQRCGLCKKELKKGPMPYDRVRISKLVDLQTAKVLMPHLSPEEFICRDPCLLWVNSKTRLDKPKTTRTWTGFTVGKDTLPVEEMRMDHDSTATMPSTSAEGSGSKIPNTKGSLENVDVPRLSTVLPTNWNVKKPSNNSTTSSTSEQKSSNNSTMSSTSEQSAEGSSSKIVNCSLCKKDLIYTNRGYERIRISKLVDKKTAQVLLPHLSPDEFICRHPCADWVKSKTKSKIANGTKRIRTWTGFSMTNPLPCKKGKMDHVSTNMNSGSTSDGASSAPKKRSRVQKALTYLTNRHYYYALKCLLEHPPAKKAFNKVCEQHIRRERMKLVRDKEGPFRKQLTPENLSSFSWKKTNEWVEEKAPLTLSSLRGMFPLPQKLAGQHAYIGNVKEEPRRAMTEEDAQRLVDKRIGMAMSIALNTGSQRHLFVQSVIGAELWREGCSEKTFKIMNGIGISHTKKNSRVIVTRLEDDHDKEVKLWKGEVENKIKKPKIPEKRKTSGLTIQVPTYSLNWDRVQVIPNRKNERLGGNRPTIWAFRFAHRNRVPFNRLWGPPKKAVEVSPDSILPSKQTYKALRQRMKTIVMRIIVDNLASLEGLRSKVERHIPHLYSKQMNEKSTVVNLGAIPVNSSTTEGDTEIMKGLKAYVPIVSEKPHKVLCCSDGLNVDTTEEEPGESAAEQRFEGLVDAPPEFHKESVGYQDIMKMLFSEKSLDARGSLSQVKSVFHVRGQCVEGKCKEAIQRVWDVDFITFVTSAYITLYVATECNLDTVDQQPSDFPTEAEAQMEWLSGLSHRLVDLVWMPPPQEDIDTAAAAARLSEVERKDSCFCGEEKPGEPLVQCCSNLCKGVWFHEGCAPMDTTTDPTVTQDWFCSPACQGDGTYIYCYCKEQRGGEMVQCALMDQCRRHEWYHKDCLSPSEQGNADSEESQWYCSEMCFIASDADDHVLNYTKALVWEGLYNLARRDAVREGDGEAMTDFWKMDMVLFWARKHLKDFNKCHQLLTGIEGFYPEHIRQDLKWNRVANLEGKPGCNISLDLVNEFMNFEFKESLARVSDHYSNERMELIGMMAGALGTEADRLLITLGGNSGGLATSLSSTHHIKMRRQAEIAEFVAEYKKDHLFRYIPGRAHEGFEKFTYQQKIKTPKKLGNTMRKLAQDMDGPTVIDGI